MRTVTATLVALTLAGVVYSGGDDAERRAKAIAPFIDNNTFIIARFDLTKQDCGDAAVTFFASAEPLGLKRSFLTSEAKDLFAALRKLGAKEVFGLGTFAGPGFSLDFVVPATDGTNVKGITELFTSGRYMNTYTAQVGSAVVFGTKEACHRYQSITPQARPELAKALAAAGDTTAQICVSFSPDARRALEETIPNLPPEVGGGSMALLTRGIQWVAIGLDGPPTSSMHAIVQTTNEAAAGKINDWLQSAMKSLAQDPKTTDTWKGLAAALQPLAAGDRLTLKLDHEQMTKFIQPLVAKNLLDEDRKAVSDKLSKIAKAMHLYHDYKKAYPTPANYDTQGMPLLSWRVHLLPHLNLDALYAQFKLDEPWDSAHNKKLIAKIPVVYQDSHGKGAAEGKTPFLVPIGPATAFPGGKGMKMPNDFSDGTSQTALVFQVADDHMAIWTKPEDWQFDPKQPHRGLVDPNRPAFMAAFADASVHQLKNTISPETLRALITRNAGDVVGKDFVDQ
jgi:hypothetical protein